MQLNSAGFKFAHYLLDTRFNRRAVRAVARDKLLNNGPQCLERQLRGECAWNQYTSSFGNDLPYCGLKELRCFCSVDSFLFRS